MIVRCFFFVLSSTKKCRPKTKKKKKRKKSCPTFPYFSFPSTNCIQTELTSISICLLYKVKFEETKNEIDGPPPYTIYHPLGVLMLFLLDQLIYPYAFDRILSVFDMLVWLGLQLVSVLT